MTNLPLSFHETINHYPSIVVEAPYEVLGEFLRYEHSVARMDKVLDAVRKVTTGSLAEFLLWQDYCTLTLKHSNLSAHVWLDVPNVGIEECTMPIDLCLKICEAWYKYLANRDRAISRL
jgi:hypothetical protein